MRSSVGTLDLVRDYEGKAVKNVSATQTKVCRYNSSIPKEHRAISSLIDEEVKDRFYGWGSPFRQPGDSYVLLCLRTFANEPDCIRKDVSQPDRASKVRERTFVLRRSVFARAPKERP
jgi:hypothetical protein